ncbi:sensor histidine kinase [Spirosoma fluviale]|uniref:histidine kinase n=1 Tax=Spirosoma fluviale TaxID=1597977 RepID=A0A286G680_9BACT|nr:PAS domain S-box protein [Spirosoma fluviale]SOD90484.1 PAS domain S-box-containing protein [Spirosoma fluviale]
MHTLTFQQPELDRLANLDTYTIIDTLPELEYDDITHLAAQICGMPISLISFIDRDRQWFKSRHGFLPLQTDRHLSFCTHAIQQPDKMMVVSDATQDRRFSENPLVYQKPGVIFYAGVPLVTEEGWALGTLCVIDNKPNQLTSAQAKSLTILARQVVTLLSLRKKTGELERTQENERREHSLRSLLINTMKEVVFQARLDGNWLFLNLAWETITGYSVAESQGRLLLDFVIEDDRPRIQTYLEQVRIGQQPLDQPVVRLSHKTGSIRYVEVFIRQTLNKHQEADGLSGTLTDITDRRQAEAALRESEERFRQIADNMEEIFWIRDLRECKFLYINSAYEAFSGLSPQPLFSDETAFLEFVFEQDRNTVLRAFQEVEQSLSYQFRARHRDGSWRWLRVRAFGIHEEGGRPSRRIGISTDITSILEKEHTLEETLKKEQDLNALKSQFITTASHEFKTPLTTISSSVELVRYYLSREPQTPFTALLTKHLNVIFERTTGLDALIMDTLTLSKLDEGKIHVLLQKIDLVALVRQVIVSDFTNREDSSQVAVSVLGDPIEVSIDAKLMSHVLTNLLSNAFKFSSTNPRLAIEFSEHTVRLAVTDQGIGIPEKDLTYLFGKFFRASNVHQIRGTGLGLAICKEYVELMQGYLEVDSTEGIGTTFTITFPLKG